MRFSNEEVTETRANEINGEAPETISNEINEEATKETNNEEIKEYTEEPTKAKSKAQARTVKAVELVECSACSKKMLPKSLRNTHPYYCKGQPTETLPVNRQKASYGTKVEEKFLKNRGKGRDSEEI